MIVLDCNTYHDQRIQQQRADRKVPTIEFGELESEPPQGSAVTGQLIVAQPVAWGGSSLGHVALAIDGTVYSFGHQGMAIMSMSAYLAANAFRDVSVLDFSVSRAAAQEGAELLRNYDDPYSVLSLSTCIQPVVYALGSMGSNVGTPLFPVNVGNALLDTGRVTGVHEYPETVPRAVPWYYPTPSAPWAR